MKCYSILATLVLILSAISPVKAQEKAKEIRTPNVQSEKEFGEKMPVTASSKPILASPFEDDAEFPGRLK